MTLSRTHIILFCLLVTGLGSSLWRVKQTHIASMSPIVQNSVPEPHCETHASPARLSDVLFPLPSKVVEPHRWNFENQRNLRALFHCIETSSCTPNQKKVVILGDKYFREVMFGWVGGEHIWAVSTIEALQNLNYTFLYGFSNERIVQMYLTFPDLVVAIFMDSEHANRCFTDTGSCVLSESNPDGIPAWKMFTFSWWTNVANDLGRQWTFSPEDYAVEGYTEPNTYLGYSIESVCRTQPFIPHSERENHAYILTKYIFNFGSDAHAWSPNVFNEASNTTGIRYAVGLDPNHQFKGKAELPANLTDYGMLPRPRFLENLAKSKILIGMNNPLNSPTPYEALCLGVPFLNPISQWDAQNRSDRMKWGSQHQLLKFLDPPYVYNVHVDDHKAFSDAIQGALSHPIESYVPEPMKATSIAARLDNLLSIDWKSKATELHKSRLERGVGPTFTV